MANPRSPNSGLFSGLVLVTVGVLILLHNYGHLELHTIVHWWPLLIIFWGLVKLYERTVGRRFGSSAGGITGGEVLLVFAMFVLLAAVVAVDFGKRKLVDNDIDIGGDSYSFDDLDIPSQLIPAGARVNIRVGHGDVTLHASDDQKLRVSAKKQVHSWSESEAAKIAKPITVVIVKNGDTYEIHPAGYELSDGRVDVDVEISVPKKSPVVVKSDKGDVTISDMTADIDLTLSSGDVEVRNTAGDVAVEMRKGDTKVSDTRGNVKVSGKGGEIEVINTSGSFTVDGDFYGPVRADKIAKGIRLITAKTDLTLSALAGHMEAASGNLDIVDAPGNLSLRTRDTEISLENLGGKVTVDNRDASVNVRFTSPPKDDVSITNSSSEISLALPGNSNFDLDATCQNCDISSEFASMPPIKSASGNAHLTGKNGTGRGPKILLKTSYGNIDVRRSSTRGSGTPAPPSPPAAEENETDQ